MKINLQRLLDTFKKWKEVKENKQPLLAENAYTLSAINKNATLDVLYKDFKKQVIDRITITAKYKKVELYFEYPDFIIEKHKKQLIEDLENLGYKIIYISKKSIIINWEPE